MLLQFSFLQHYIIFRLNDGIIFLISIQRLYIIDNCSTIPLHLVLMIMDALCPAGGGTQQNYLSIEDVIMSGEKLPCVFEVAAKGLGFLQHASNKKDITVGSKMDLPLWLVQSLIRSRLKLVKVGLTKPYKATYREIIQADSSVVDLHKLGPYYYALGQQLLLLQHNETLPLSETLLKSFCQRFMKIMNLSWNSLNCDNSSSIKKLDEMERKLFEKGQVSLHSFHRWDLGNSRKLEASNLVSRYRKRKRNEIENLQ